MAQTIVIEQGDKNLNDVTKITPDTRVNQKAVIKYPQAVEPIKKGDAMVSETFSEDDVTFTNPHPINSGSAES